MLQSSLRLVRCQVRRQTLRSMSAEPSHKPLYLDAQATTALDPRVLDSMLPYLTSYYGNPHSRTHQYGWESEAAMEKARAQVANIIGEIAT